MFVYVVVIGLLGLTLNALLIGVVSMSFPAAAAELKGYPP
jgi:hypothetical protein